MARLVLKLAGYPWDHITPLLTGDVVPEGIDLQYDVHHGLGPVTDDPSCAGGEASLGRFMIETSRGHRHFVGLPIFPMFAFRHRCFLVQRGTTIDDLSALEGKRVGLDGWPNSGNTWTRVMLRQAGVDIWNITWVIAPIEGPADASHDHGPPEALPNVQGGPPGKSLVDLLLAGEIDVLVAAFMPTGFFSPESPIVPMIPDYREGILSKTRLRPGAPSDQAAPGGGRARPVDHQDIDDRLYGVQAPLVGAASPPRRHDALAADGARGDGGYLRR